jgi:hypothetical protein
MECAMWILEIHENQNIALVYRLFGNEALACFETSLVNLPLSPGIGEWRRFVWEEQVDNYWCTIVTDEELCWWINLCRSLGYVDLTKATKRMWAWWRHGVHRMKNAEILDMLTNVV